ncbi:Actin-depolymerizing factor 2 [Bulinus truncatus]|nr:Actin-depolymerizing factor 2 [Bulinus truncatus]
MASGIKISDEVKEYCQKVTMNKAGQQKLQFAILTFSADNKAVVVESSGTQEEAKPYDEIIKALPANDVRYLIVDFPYVNKDGVSKSEVILISW